MRNKYRQVAAFTEVKQNLCKEPVTSATVLSPKNNPSIKTRINILNYFSEISTFNLLMDASSLCIPFQLQIFWKTLGQVALPPCFVIPTRG